MGKGTRLPVILRMNDTGKSTCPCHPQLARVILFASFVCCHDGTIFAPIQGEVCLLLRRTEGEVLPPNCRGGPIWRDGMGEREIERRAMNCNPNLITAFEDRDEAQVAVDELE